MLILRVSSEHPDPRVIARAVEILGGGGVVAYPTDTLYGLAVDPRREDAVEKLFALKGRARGVALPLIAADAGQADGAGQFGDRERRLASAFWPGPLSLVVPARPVVARAVLGGRDTVAIRVPAHQVARALASAFGFCLTATSANPSGAPAVSSGHEVAEALAGADLLLDAGPTPGGPPSTIVAMDDHGPVLVRAGAIAWDRVLKSLE